MIGKKVMKSRRILVISLSVIFAAILVFSFFFAFTVKKVNATFSVFDGSDAECEKLKTEFDNFLGRNLLFFDEKEVEKIVADYPLFEVKSVSKNYPDGIFITVAERKEVYLFSSGDKNFVISEDGKAIRNGDKTSDGGLVKLSIVNFGETEVKLGEVISTDYTENLLNAFAIAKSVKLTDKVSEIKIERKLSTKKPEELGVYETVITFSTLTEVNVTVWDADNGGEEKALAVFDKFDSLSDYEKSFYDLEVDFDSEGKIVIVWTKDGTREVI